MQGKYTNIHLASRIEYFLHPRIGRGREDCFQWTKYDLSKYQPILGPGVECFETSLEIWETLLGWVEQNVVSIRPIMGSPYVNTPNHFKYRVIWAPKCEVMMVKDPCPDNWDNCYVPFSSFENILHQFVLNNGSSGSLILLMAPFYLWSIFNSIHNE